MSIIKRLSTTLVSRIDQVVGEIENHDAVIQASLKEMGQKISQAKITLNQACREKERLSDQLKTQQQNIHRWHSRAVDCAQSDESKAIECMRRAHQCQEHTKTLQKTLTEYEQSIARMSRDIQINEQQLVSMQQKLTLMRARQATNNANSSINSPDNEVEIQLNDTFNRWEMNFNHNEIPLNYAVTMDPLEEEFITQEQNSELRHELAELLAKEEQK